MELEKLSAEMKPRSAWEAVDLGCPLVRENAKTMLVSSLIINLPLWAGLHAAVATWGWFWPLFLFWWLKPIWERVHLYILGNALFGEKVSVRETLKKFFSIAKVQWLSSLTLRRLSVTRSLDLPVIQLEHQAGKAREQRIHLLHQRTAGTSVWLLTVCAHIESFLVLGTYLMLDWMIPAEMSSSAFGWMTRDALGMQIFYNLIPALAMTLVAPYFVGCGFALYLNRRCSLEAWDIEINFRRLAQRIQQRREKSAMGSAGSSTRARSALVLALLLASVLFSGTPCHSRENLNADESKASIEEVLSGEDFHTPDSYRIPKFIHDLNWDPEVEEEPKEIPDWLKSIFEFVARFSRTIIIALLVGLLLILLFRYREPLRNVLIAAKPEKKSPPPRFISGLAISPESLPADVIGEVRALWEQGDSRSALALLYRATLASLVNAYSVPLSSSHTENECLRTAAPFLSEEKQEFLHKLTQTWQQLAYAHRPLSGELLLSLSNQWPAYFSLEGSEVDDER
jgi:hypothetical protein